jgi:hypothetical protein
VVGVTVVDNDEGLATASMASSSSSSSCARPSPVALARHTRILELEAEGASLAGIMAAAAGGLVGLIAEALEHGYWHGDGDFRSPEHWAAVRFGLGPARARRLVAAARALVALPEIRAAFAAGELTEDHVAEIVRAEVSAHHDAEVLGIARNATVTQLRTALSFLPPAPAPPAEPDAADEDPEPGPVPEPGPERVARVGFGDREDGTWGLVASGLNPLDGAVVDKALQAARNQLFRLRHGPDADAKRVMEVSWADALVHLARVGLDALDPDRAGGGDRRPGERYLINVHLRAEEPDRARIHLGSVLPAHLCREAACDALVRAWVTDQLGNVGLGRTARVVDPKLRTVVEHRDGGCRVPGCGATRWVVIHHIWHWEDNGPTETWNLVALCPEHHRAVHRGDLIITGNADLPGDLAVTNRHGRPLAGTPPNPPGAPPDQAAGAAGLQPSYRARSGERASWYWLTWSEHPT